ncbi:MAG: Maf family protein [bacterium]|nr:Maf family protein [bacterium]
MATSGPRIILASNSPRRRDILERLGLPFEVVPAGLPEETDAADAVDRPAQVAEALALAKADAVADDHPEALVLGADTLVCVGGRCLGKPADAAEARTMLEALSGRTHTVVTGVALIGRERGLRATAHEATDVTFRRLSEREIAGYAASGEPADKAGAYAVQGKAGLFVERVDGDYDNVVGLPLKTVARLLEAAGVELWPKAGEGA